MAHFIWTRAEDASDMEETPYFAISRIKEVMIFLEEDLDENLT